MAVLRTTKVFRETRAELWLEVPIIQEKISTLKSRPQFLCRICTVCFLSCWGIEKRPTHEPNVHVEGSKFWPADASSDSNIRVLVWGVPRRLSVKKKKRRQPSHHIDPVRTDAIRQISFLLIEVFEVVFPATYRITRGDKMTNLPIGQNSKAGVLDNGGRGLITPSDASMERPRRNIYILSHHFRVVVYVP